MINKHSLLCSVRARVFLISWIQWPLTPPLLQLVMVVHSITVGLHKHRENWNTHTSALQTHIHFCFYFHTHNSTASFCSSLCFAVSTFSLAEGLKVITDAVHFISMRTKTAWGTHYHFTEKDRELSASLFMSLHSDIFYQRRHCRLTRTAFFFLQEGTSRARRGRRKKTPTDREAEDAGGITLWCELCTAKFTHHPGLNTSGEYSEAQNQKRSSVCC